MRSTLSALVALVLCTSAASAAFAQPAIYNLGTFGGTLSLGSGVNNAGQVAGYSYTAGDTAERAFRYDYDGTPGSGGVMRDLGTLGGPASIAWAVNDAGQVAGSSYLAPFPADQHAFRYDGTPGSGGVMRDLGTLGGNRSFGHGVNASGQVAGVSNVIGHIDRAFRYDGTPGSGGVMRDLGTLAGGAVSYAFDVNDAGQVAGYSALGLAWRAFRYDGTPGSGGVMRDLGTLGGTVSFGRAVNASGQVAGDSETEYPTNRAFRYDGTPGSGGVMRDLGTLGGRDSGASDVNNAGQVAGWSWMSTGPADVHAFLYTGTPGVDGQMIDLDTWLDANNPAEGAKWTLENATSLSDTGWITGSGDYDPDGPGGVAAANRAFLLDASSIVVPEPAGLGLLAAAAGAAVLRRRVRRW